MPTIKITVTEKLASLEGSPVYVCGNSDYSVAFTFDAEWSAQSDRRIEPGVEVRVVAQENLTLRVEPIS